ncbi:ACT domain-containing protein [Epidermidibacterium keratini]|uniref:ACT domain-containing protein n=1 Tax=Epidermidibacterium keratini TaxID=1891644 RepID=A0A7L4YKR6_9ACTN|nr:ACT domain-containing protein [Epidermidibacterium keratini]QHB99657.1 ACT domain-containing protein [Epidermidibacterium keratini]
MGAKHAQADTDEARSVDELLATLTPRMRSGKFVFAAIKPTKLELLRRADAVITEDEGITAVISKDIASEQNLDYEYVAAWITLSAQTGLHVVGVTAVVSSAFAEAGISCNVLAGLNHDHLLVPWKQREDAIEVIRDVSQAAADRLEQGALAS